MGDCLKFSERLSELIQTKEITTNQLGEVIGVNGSTVRLWTGGKRHIRLKNAVALSDYFNCSLEFLAGRSETVIDFTPKTALPFYDCLREIMQQREITRYRIVHDLKKSHKHFDQWKTGSDPLLETVIEFADYFEMSLDAFIGRDR